MKKFLENKKINWYNYGLFMLRSRLHWIKTQNPKIYDFYDMAGKCRMQTGDDRYIQEYEKNGYSVIAVDNKKLIEDLKTNIERFEEKIESGAVV